MPTKPAVRGRTDQVRFFCNAREPAYTSEEGRKNRRKPIHYREPRSPSLNFQSHRLRLVYCVTSRAALDLALTLAPPQQSLCTQRTVGFKLAQKESKGNGYMDWDGITHGPFGRSRWSRRLSSRIQWTPLSESERRRGREAKQLPLSSSCRSPYLYTYYPPPFTLSSANVELIFSRTNL